jgi:hopanoid C-3 methylase
MWTRLGLQYMFLGLEAIDEEGLRKYRKRISLGHAFEALEFARSLGITVAINLIADPEWDRERFAVVRQWCLEIPEIVNISVNTPYPGTETWRTEARRLQTRDYRLYDIQHAVLPTRMPLADFYEELVSTQRVLAMKHMGWTAFRDVATLVLRHFAHGQTNFFRSLWKFNSVFNPKLLLADHQRPVSYEMKLPPPAQEKVDPRLLYVLQGRGRKGRAIDDATEQFVDATRMGTTE